MDELNFENTYWEKIVGYVTELRVDKRWRLRDSKSEKPIGSLRIVSHPDLKPGYLRAIFIYITNIKSKSKGEILQTMEDYQMEVGELELYSIEDDIKTDTIKYEAPYKELEELFDIDIFE